MTHTLATFRRISVLTAMTLAVFLMFSTVAFAQDAQLKNPLSSDFSDIPKFIAGALKILVMVALPVITLFFVYSGFMFVAAQGKPEKLNKAKMNFVYVVIGAILILGAWIIATMIGGTVSQLTGGQ